MVFLVYIVVYFEVIYIDFIVVGVVIYYYKHVEGYKSWYLELGWLAKVYSLLENLDGEIFIETAIVETVIFRLLVEKDCLHKSFHLKIDTVRRVMIIRLFDAHVYFVYFISNN